MPAVNKDGAYQRVTEGENEFPLSCLIYIQCLFSSQPFIHGTATKEPCGRREGMEKQRLGEHGQRHGASERIAGSLASPPANVRLAARTPETHPSPSPLDCYHGDALFASTAFLRRTVFTDHEITSFPRQTGTHTIFTDFFGGPE